MHDNLMKFISEIYMLKRNRREGFGKGVVEAGKADERVVVLTADLSCLKNVRLLLDTMRTLNYESAKVQLVLNRSNAYTGINVKNAEGALKLHITIRYRYEPLGVLYKPHGNHPF